MINKIEFTKKELKTFTKIYASNWNHVPRIFNPNDYQGKGIDGKIEQFISDLKNQNIKKQKIEDILWNFHHTAQETFDHNHQNQKDFINVDTKSFIDSICELLEYPSE